LQVGHRIGRHELTGEQLNEYQGCELEILKDLFLSLYLVTTTLEAVEEAGKLLENDKNTLQPGARGRERHRPLIRKDIDGLRNPKVLPTFDSGHKGTLSPTNERRIEMETPRPPSKYKKRER